MHVLVSTLGGWRCHAGPSPCARVNTRTCFCVVLLRRRVGPLRVLSEREPALARACVRPESFSRARAACACVSTVCARCVRTYLACAHVHARLHVLSLPCTVLRVCRCVHL
eukprot:1008908-Pleurochrysis_carterae.AAC.4